MTSNGSHFQGEVLKRQVNIKSMVAKPPSHIGSLKGKKRNVARLPKTQPESIWNRQGSQLNVEPINPKRARLEGNTELAGDAAPSRDALVARYSSVASCYSRTDSYVPDYVVPPHQRTNSQIPDYMASPHSRTDSYIPDYSILSKKRQRSSENADMFTSRKSQRTSVPRDWQNAEFTFRPTGAARHVQDRFPEARGWLHCPTLKRSRCEPGTIILAQWVKPLLDKSIQVGDKYRVDTEYGPLIVKVRPFVVFAFNYDHMIVLPIYSYNGRGIIGMPREKQQEHVAILGEEEYRTQQSNPSTERYGGNDPMTIDPTTTANGWSISRGSSVRFTEQETIDLKTPVFPAGRLRPECTKTLMRLTAQHFYQCYATHSQKK